MKTTFKYLICLCLMGLVCITCSEEEDKPQCSNEVIINAEHYQNAPDDHLQIMSARIEGDCLLINMASGGCDGSTWEVKLLTDGNVMESAPPQRNIRLSLKNEEVCDAWITHDYAFDIRALQVSGNEVLLNLTNNDGQLSYSY